MKDPIDFIEWLPVVRLRFNDWNPNVTFNTELNLLARNILMHGWVQPIIINRDELVIDGFHRCKLVLDNEEIKSRWGGLVPCARMDLSDPDAMMLTVRMNRAKGQHIALRMSDLAKRLTEEHGLTKEEIALGIGAGHKEVDLLLAEDVFEGKNLAAGKYSKAWVPWDDGKLKGNREVQ